MQSWESYKSFHPLWCWVWLVSLWEMISHPSRCELTLVRIDAVVWARLEWWRWFGFRQVTWLVKDRILGVDPPGQHVPPRVRSGTTCLLIRGVVESVSYSVVWEGYRDYLRAARCKRGRGTIVGAITCLGLPWETIVLLWYCDYLS